MATRLVNIDRDTPMLLPPDLRDWVPEDDLVHFVIEAVAGMRLTMLAVNHRGTGSRQYPPKTMLVLLIYCYANGIFSSRRIEKATYRDVAVRYLMADTHPDHDTIATFRRANFEAIGEAFLETLKLAKALGLVKVGTVSVDGTHIRASASKNRNVRYDRAGELEAQLRHDIDELLRQAEQADANGDDDSSLPKTIDRLEKLRAKMREAREQLEAQNKARAEQERAEYEEKMAKYEARNRRGKEPQPPSEEPQAREQTNLTDGDSRLMRKSRRSSFEQCYNAQAAVDADGSMLILSQHVTNLANDVDELLPALRNIPEELKPTAALADSGYASIDNIEQLENDIDLYVAMSAGEQRQYDFRPPKARDKPPKPLKDERLLRMRAKLETDEGKRIYAKRKQTVEPVFGIIKSVLGFRQFLLRGLEKVSGEWSLVTLAYNFKRLATLRAA